MQKVSAVSFICQDLNLLKEHPSQRDYLHEEAPVLQTVTAPTVALIEHLFTACDSYLLLYYSASGTIAL